MKKNLKKKNKKGFTLIELVVVIAILGILAAILIPVIGGFITRANESAYAANARNIYNTASMYMATGGAGGQTFATLMGDSDFTSLFGTALPNGIATGDVTITYNAADNKLIDSVKVKTVTYYAGGAVS